MNEDSIESLKEERDEKVKLKYFLNLEKKNHDSLVDYYNENYGSLGIIRIRPLDLYWKEASNDWKTKQEKVLSQMKLFGPQPKKLEKIPWEFRLHFECWDKCSVCEKHYHDKLFLTWDVYQAYRNFRDRFGSEKKGLNEVEKKFWQFFAEDKYCFLLMGTHSKHHKSWMIGSYYCTKIEIVNKYKSQTSLFNHLS